MTKDKASGMLRAVGYFIECNRGRDAGEVEGPGLLSELTVSLCGHPIESFGDMRKLLNQRVEVLIVPLGDTPTYREQGLERQVKSLTCQLNEANDKLAKLRKKLKRRADDAQVLLG